MRYRILSALVVFSMVGACGPKKKRHKPEAQPTPSPVSQEKPKGKGEPFIQIEFGNSRSRSVECASKDDTSLDPQRVIQRKTINLKMEKQRVVRKDCSGNVISDGMEKVTTPYLDIELTPTKTWAGKSVASPYNRTTCTGPGAELEKLLLSFFGVGLITEAYDGVRNSLGFPRVRFSVDTSPTTSSMHVRKNADNYIDYEFEGCAQRKRNGECEKRTSVEKGTLILTVNYTENLDIGGVKEVPAIDCDKAKNPVEEKPANPPASSEPKPPSELPNRDRLAGDLPQHEG